MREPKETKQKPSSQKQNKKRSSLHKGLNQWKQVLPFLILGIIGTSVFVIYPLIKGVIMSFQDYNIMPGAESPWIGFENYLKAFQDETFGYAVRNTVLNTIVTVPINWFLGLFFAVLINSKLAKAKITFRTIYYLPIITSWVVVAFIFKFLFAAGDSGFINYLFHDVLGVLDEPIGWLQNQWSAMTVIWIIHVWKTVGWSVVIYLAALQSIPKELYEASSLDGAKPWQVFRFITIPMVAPMTVFVLINLIIGAFNIFPQVYFVTGGAPMGQTEVLQSMVYVEAFENFNFGYSSALGVMMGIAIFLITWTQQKKIGNQKLY